MATVLKDEALSADRRAPAAPEMTWHTIGDGFPGHHFHGCRLGHLAQLGIVGFRLHGGATPVQPSRDEPVQFLLDGDELDDLIAVLTGIRNDLRGGGDHGLCTRTVEKIEGMAFARGWRCGLAAARELNELGRS
jgi:hypothetical protein